MGHIHSSRARAIAICAALAAGACCGSALGQAGPGGRAATPADALPDARPPAPVELRPPAPPAPDVAIPSGVTVRAFRFTGLTALDPSELAPVVAAWTGRPLTGDDLAAVLREVASYLRGRGLFAASARIPPQPFAEGVVEIAVLEGRLGAVTLDLAPDARLERATAERILSALRPGTLIRRGRFDTPLLLLNDLPGVIVAPTLSPGRAPGTADLEIRAADEPLVAGTLRLDNNETPEVGRYVATAHLRLRNPRGIGDLATGELRSTPAGDYFRATLSYSLPVNAAGTRIAAIVAQQRYTLGEQFEALRANGDTDEATLVLSHPLLRTNATSVFGDVSLHQYYFRDRIDLFNLETTARHRHATMRLRGDHADGLLGGGSTAAYVEYQAGRVDLDAQSAAFDAVALRTAGSFGRWRAAAQRTQAVSAASVLSAFVFAQWASKNLAAGREFELTGPDAVRAYPVRESVPDEGYLARLDYEHRLPSGDGWRAAGGVFWDTGRGRINKDPLPGTPGNARTYSGPGVRLVAGYRERWNAGVSLAWRTTAAPLRDRDLHPRTWFFANAYF
jgi:hemolysin activation/secretion protein